MVDSFGLTGQSLVIAGDCLELLRKMAPKSVDLVFTSPPYPLKTSRYDGARQKMSWQEWSHWMAEVVEECCLVSRGFVLVNANNPVVKGEMLPAIELMVMELHEASVKIERPLIWHKNSAPNKRPWWVNCWEPILAFYDGESPRPTVWNWESIATPPKYKSGGAFRQRDAKGNRRIGSDYPTNKLTRPRDVSYVTVGGGHLGSKEAHESEAPFPPGIVEPAIKALTNENGIVLDPFCGSGTTLAVALKNNRRAIGFDVRQSQVELTGRRLAEVENDLLSKGTA